MIVLLTWVGTGCWVVCFWWMHRISRRQESLLNELHAVARRIEEVSRAEHEIIQQVHPSVEQIKERVENVAEAVAETTK